jgi:diaminohydroxyphosphoribosylaminopyrimidine deaminase/5-amino-6-(5-phosphoribosylamino)uracil reductase
MVGCVLVHDGQIIGEGYHEEFGGPHAEVMAYKNAIKDPVDATVYVTLEPCSIQGKTPPCAQFLIENSAAEVYIAMLDPNPEINGIGVKTLRNAGIKVKTGILQEEAEWLNRGFTKFMTEGRPWVIAKAAQSANGFLGINSESQTWITGEESKEHSHKLRAHVDSIMVGRQTALIDDPQLTVRKVAGKNPIRIIVDTNRKLPLTLKVFRDHRAQTLVLCSNARFERSRTSFCDYVPVTEDEDGQLEPYSILSALTNEGVTSVLIEGGANLLRTFYDKDLIDEIYLYTSTEELENASLTNPIRISEDWDVKESKRLGEDSLVIAQRKVKCLQES